MSTRIAPPPNQTPANRRIIASATSGMLPNPQTVSPSCLIAVPVDDNVQILNTNPPFFGVDNASLSAELEAMLFQTYGYVSPVSAAVSSGSATTALAMAAGRAGQWLGLLCSVQSGKLDPDANTGTVSITCYLDAFNAFNVNDKLSDGTAAGTSSATSSTLLARFQYSKAAPLIRFALFGARVADSGIIVPDFLLMRTPTAAAGGLTQPATFNASAAWTGLPGTTSTATAEPICKDSPNRNVFLDLIRNIG